MWTGTEGHVWDHQEKQFNLPVDCQLDHFDKVIMSVLLYGCEVCGNGSIEIIELIHFKLLKHILNLKSCTPSISCMVCGETGRFPLPLNIY